jgi:BirA family transcriptional regulator, biotin operon repressor / biotin---[acetyl-CoA-carboxylase] ligase
MDTTHTRFLFDTRIHFPVTDSTNARARACAVRGDPEGVVVTADGQTDGRGRLGRSWEAEEGESLLASYLLRPSRPIGEWGGLPLLCGIAASEALHAVAGMDVSLRWPNDVVTARGKICGILVETGIGAASWAVCGIGINVRQRGFEGSYRTAPSSVAMETGIEIHPDAVLDALSAALRTWYGTWTARGNTPVFEAWRQRCSMLGRPVSIASGTSHEEVVAEDLAEDGGLIVRHANGRRQVVHAGDVSLLEVTQHDA